MAILRPSKNFEGGDLNQKGSSYLKPGLRVVDFRNKENGVYLFLLSAYKLDPLGNGVWYKPVRLRDNFGTGFKEKFAIQPNCPIEYFENRMRSLAPDMCKVKESSDDSGRTRKIYPLWGRGNAIRVLYNAALFNDLQAGPHVLDLPQFGGASVIDEYVHGKQPDGSDNPDINDYEAAIALNIKLDLKASGQPWKIQINNSKTYKLPPELADADQLYNLDEVVVYQDKEVLIEKLRGLVPADVFAKGLEGYSLGTIQLSMGATFPPAGSKVATESAEEDNLDMTPGPSSPPVFENPVALPKPTKSIAPTIAVAKAAAKPAEANLTPPENAAPARADVMAAAAAFLKTKKV